MANRLAEQHETMTSPEASLHHAAFVMDGLVYHSDGDTAALKAGGINAINLTVAHFEADFTTACRQMAGWPWEGHGPPSRACLSCHFIVLFHFVSFRFVSFSCS